MASQHHIIRKQRVEVDFPSEMEISDAPKAIGDVFNTRILPAMEKLFDQYGGDMDVLSFDRMEVDCGTLESVGWEDQLVDRTLSQLKERLQMRVAEAKTFETASASRRTREAWVYFLKRGHLAWDSPVSNVATFEEALPVDEALVEALLLAINQAPVALDRYLRSFSLAFRARVLTEMKKNAGDACLTGLLDDLPKNWQREDTLQRAIITALARVFYGGHVRKAGGVGLTLSVYADELLRYTPGNRQVRACRAIAVVYERQEASLGTAFFIKYADTPALMRLEREIRRRSDEAGYRWDQERAAARKQKSLGTAVIPDAKGDMKSKAADAGPDSSRHEQPSGNAANWGALVEDDNGIFIENAGLVLVHPFLNPLFETLGWVEQGMFKSHEHAGLGALLLQYMAQGDVPAEEAMLPLNKVLCGLSPMHFVDVEARPDAVAMQEADKVLEAVIQHWEVLKNTSIEGLRETFLCRSGKMEHKGDAWTVQVETKGVDILLNQLPWGLSVVKLPWTSELLQVSWI